MEIKGLSVEQEMEREKISLCNAAQAWKGQRWFSKNENKTCQTVETICSLNHLVSKTNVQIVGSEKSGKKTMAKYLSSLYGAAIQSIVQTELKDLGYFPNGILIMAQPDEKLLSQVWNHVQGRYASAVMTRWKEFSDLLQNKMPKYSGLLLWEDTLQWFIISISEQYQELTESNIIPDYKSEKWIRVFSGLSGLSPYKIKKT